MGLVADGDKDKAGDEAAAEAETETKVAAFDDPESDAVHDATGRDGISGGCRIAGVAVPDGSGEFFAEFKPAKCPASVFCLHHLSPAAAGVDGGGQVDDLGGFWPPCD